MLLYVHEWAWWIRYIFLLELENTHVFPYKYLTSFTLSIHQVRVWTIIIIYFLKSKQLYSFILMANFLRCFFTLLIILLLLSIRNSESRVLVETTFQAAALVDGLGQLPDQPGPTGSPVELSKRVSPTGPDPHHHWEKTISRHCKAEGEFCYLHSQTFENYPGEEKFFFFHEDVGKCKWIDLE